MSYTIELNDAELLKVGIKSISDFYSTMAINCKQETDLLGMVTGCNSPFLNVVIDTRTIRDSNAHYIQTFSDFFNQHKVPWSWIIASVTKNNDLEKCGLSLIEETPSMYFDLSGSLPTNTSPLVIKEMNSEDDLSRWIEPIREGFPSKDNGECFRKLNASLLQQGEKKLRQFVGFSKEQPIIAGTLFLSENAVMLHNIATKTAFQKCGFGTALTLHMMNIAKQLEFKHCFLDSSEDGFSLYRKIGFKIYCTTLFYQIVAAQASP